MSEQLQHDVLPHATHDELARQHFVQSLKVYLASKVSPGSAGVVRNGCPRQLVLVRGAETLLPYARRSLS
jgi:hypothetical protein